MPRIHKSIDIDASREHVFALAVDPARQPEWITFIKEIEITSGDGKSAGTTDRCVFKLGPRTQTFEAEWTEYKANESFARRATSGATMQGRMTFTPTDGSTLVQWTVEYRPPFGPLGALFDLLFMNRVFQNEMEESLDKLKEALES